MAVVEPHAEPRIGKQFEDSAVEFDQVFFCQTGLLDKETGAPRHPRMTIDPPSDRAQIDCGDPAALTLLKLEAELLTLA